MYLKLLSQVYLFRPQVEIKPSIMSVLFLHLLFVILVKDTARTLNKRVDIYISLPRLFRVYLLPLSLRAGEHKGERKGARNQTL